MNAIDQGEETAGWFSDWLGVSVRLVHVNPAFKRKLNPDYAVSADDHTGFADGYPILAISEESLQDLNSKLDASRPLPMNRFRPNMVVKGCEPFAEDSWKRIRIGDVDMTMVAGKIVVDGGKLLTADIQQLIADANKVVPDLFRRRAEWLAAHKPVNALVQQE